MTAFAVGQGMPKVSNDRTEPLWENISERARAVGFVGDSSEARLHVVSPAVYILFHLVVVTLGILSMGFQLLASRLLSPHFGSSLIVWAWLISTFLAAFSVGSLAGGWVSSLSSGPRARALWVSAFVAVATLAFTATLGRWSLGRIEEMFPNPGPALFLSCVGVFFLPVAALSSFGPQCVQYLAARGTPPGKASGLVYAVSTLGNIAGVMLTAFVLIPHFRVSTLLFGWLAVAALSLACLLGLLLRPVAP
ncbi:MAG TPA: fused MFS/spermidine synthase [Lacunisphaera sp.]|nr:fused MFS/spermidine synthase [Lacunisphaera sp.]